MLRAWVIVRNTINYLLTAFKKITMIFCFVLYSFCNWNGNIVDCRSNGKDDKKCHKDGKYWDSDRWHGMFPPLSNYFSRCAFELLPMTVSLLILLLCFPSDFGHEECYCDKYGVWECVNNDYNNKCHWDGREYDNNKWHQRGHTYCYCKSNSDWDCDHHSSDDSCDSIGTFDVSYGLLAAHTKQKLIISTFYLNCSSFVRFHCYSRLEFGRSSLTCIYRGDHL